jgi:predicted NodU family carbamoyl transferase
VQDVAATKTKTSKRNASHFTRSMQTEAQRIVNALILYLDEHTNGTDLALRFRVAHLSGARKFLLRQGLWIEDLQIPPGQECSNGSMILLAVVLWRASFFGKRRHFACTDPVIRNETSQDQNSALLPDNGKLR